MIDEEKNEQDAPEEEPQAEEPQAEEPQAEEPQAEEQPPEEQPAEETPAPEPEAVADADADAQPEADAESAAPPKPKKKAKKDASDEEVIPGAHLEPDLVLEEEQGPTSVEELAAAEAEVDEPGEEPETPAPAPAAAPLDLAADARYQATGKRKSAVARVVLKPGDGSYAVNGRGLDEFFPRQALQIMARQPLETTGNSERMDVVARIHGGGVAAQAGALRHGIARALVEADPNLRTELKRRGYLTRDPRVKERKKAGLKKARKRPQFSKR